MRRPWVLLGILAALIVAGSVLSRSSARQRSAARTTFARNSGDGFTRNVTIASASFS